MRINTAPGEHKTGPENTNDSASTTEETSSFQNYNVGVVPRVEEPPRANLSVAEGAAEDHENEEPESLTASSVAALSVNFSQLFSNSQANVNGIGRYESERHRFRSWRFGCLVSHRQGRS